MNKFSMMNSNELHMIMRMGLESSYSIDNRNGYMDDMKDVANNIINEVVEELKRRRYDVNLDWWREAHEYNKNLNR